MCLSFVPAVWNCLQQLDLRCCPEACVTLWNCYRGHHALQCQECNAGEQGKKWRERPASWDSGLSWGNEEVQVKQRPAKARVMESRLGVDHDGPSGTLPVGLPQTQSRIMLGAREGSVFFTLCPAHIREHRGSGRGDRFWPRHI